MKNLPLLLWMIFVFQVTAYSQDTLKVPGANDIRIVQFLGEYIDCSGRERAIQVVEKWKQGKFQPMPAGSVVNRGITDCTHWFSISISNQSKYRENYLWSFYNDGIKFSLFEMADSSNFLISRRDQSHFMKLADREVPLRSVSFEIPLEAGETKSFLLKTEVFGRKTLYFPTDISTKSDILTYELGLSFLLGRYYGFFFFAMLFNLFLFIILKKRFYAMMLGYISCLVAFNTVEYLHDVYLIPSFIYEGWARIPKLSFLALTLYFNVHVFIAFVQQDKFLPNYSHRLKLLNRVALIAVFFYLLLNLLLPQHSQILEYFQYFFVAVLLMQTFGLLMNIWIAIRQRTPFIMHYLLGNTLLIISVLLYLFSSLNYIHIPQFIRPGNIIFAFAVEVIYLMIVFTVKYKQDFEFFKRSIEQSEEKRRQLAHELIITQEKERLRIAQDVHDGIGGTIQGLRLLLSKENLQQSGKVQEMLKGINFDFKRLIHQIAPRNLELNGLFETIRSDVQAFAHQFEIHLSCIGNEYHIPWDMKVHVFRIYQELLTNAVKHAKNASLFEVDLAVDESEVRLMVHDNGRSEEFDMDLIGKGMGMSNLRSRVDYYDGSFDFIINKEGCSVNIVLPLKKKGIQHD